MRDAPVGSDINFSEEALSMRFNSELADTYGNLVNRGLKLCESYCGGKVPSEAAEPILSVAELLAKTEAAYAAITTHRLTYRPPPTTHLLSPTTDHLPGTLPSRSRTRRSSRWRPSSPPTST